MKNEERKKERKMLSCPRALTQVARPLTPSWEVVSSISPPPPPPPHLPFLIYKNATWSATKSF